MAQQKAAINLGTSWNHWELGRFGARKDVFFFESEFTHWGRWFQRSTKNGCLGWSSDTKPQDHRNEPSHQRAWVRSFLAANIGYFVGIALPLVPSHPVSSQLSCQLSWQLSCRPSFRLFFLLSSQHSAQLSSELSCQLFCQFSAIWSYISLYQYISIHYYDFRMIFDSWYSCLVVCFWLCFDLLFRWAAAMAAAAPGSDAAVAVLPSSPPRQRRLWPQMIYPGTIRYPGTQCLPGTPQNQWRWGRWGVTELWGVINIHKCHPISVTIMNKNHLRHWFLGKKQPNHPSPQWCREAWLVSFFDTAKITSTAMFLSSNVLPWLFQKLDSCWATGLITKWFMGYMGLLQAMRPPKIH